jgi:hypothetical protein
MHKDNPRIWGWRVWFCRKDGGCVDFDLFVYKKH